MARDLRLQVLLSTVDKITGPLKKVMSGGRATDKALAELNSRMGILRRSQDELQEFGSLQAGLKKLTPALAAAQARTAELARQIQNTDEPSKKLVRSFERAKAEAKRLKDEFQGNSQRLQVLRDRLGAAGVSTDRLENEQNALRLKINATNQSIAKQKQHLEQLAAAQRRAQEMAERWKSGGMTATTHGAGAFLLGQQAMPAATAPMAAFMEQDSAAAQLRSSLMGSDGKVAKDYGEVAALAARLGNQLPGTTADLTRMMDELARAGVSTRTILGGAGEAAALLKVRIGDSMSYADAARSMAVLQTATRTTEADMVALADTMQRAAGLNVAPDKMVAAFANLAPALSMMRTEGLDAVEKLAPLLTQAIRGGMSGESAGIAIVAAMRRSMDADRIAKANEALSGSGIALDFSDGKGEFGGLDQAFQQLEQLRSLTTAHRNEVLKQLYGDDAQVSTIADIISKGGADGYADIQRQMAAQGSLQQRVGAQLDSLPAKWESATGTLQNTLAKLGEATAPLLIPVLEVFTDVLESIQGLIARFPQLSGAIGVAAAGFAGLLLVGGAVMTFAGVVATGIGHLIPLLAPVKTSLAGLSTLGPALQASFAGALPVLKMLGGMIAGLSAPVWLTVGAVIAAGLTLYKYWDYVAAFFGGVWDGIVTALAPVRAAFAEAFAPLHPVIDAVLGVLGSLWETVSGFLAPVDASSEALSGWANAGRFLGEVLGGALGLIAKLVLLPLKAFEVLFEVLKALFAWSPLGLIASNWGAMSGVLSAVWDGIKGGASVLWDWLKTAFAWSPLGLIASNWGVMSGVLSAVWEGIKSGAAALWSWLTEAFAGGYSRLVADITAVLGVVGGLWERFKSIGANLLQGLVQGLLGGLAAVKSTIGNVADSVVGWLKEKLGINSPSRVFAELGGFTVSGFAQGLDAARREPVEAMRRVAGAVTAAGAAMAVGASGSALAIDSRPALAGRAPTAAASAGITIGAIHIHAGAGVDAQGIAKAVRDEIERLDRERGARRRSALSDTDI